MKDLHAAYGQYAVVTGASSGSEGSNAPPLDQITLAFLKSVLALALHP